MWKTQTNSTTKLTLELREIIENGINIFDFDYPSYYKGEEKTAFEQKVIDHFYFRQIGFETVGRFKHYLRARLNEVMPRFIDLYKTVEIMDNIKDPFGNVDVTETYTETRTGTDTGSQSANSSGSSTNSTTNHATDTVNQSDSREQRFSDTPQSRIENIDEYLTNATVENNSSDNTTIRTGTGEVTGSDSSESSGTFENNRTETVEHEYKKTGNQGVNTYAHDMIEYRTSIIDVDVMVIDSLNCLFLGVY